MENYKNKKIKPKINKFYVSFAAVCFILAFLNAYSVSDLFFTKENTELSEQYNRKLKETSMIPHKKHIIVSGIKPDCYVSVKNTDSAVPDIVLTKNKANAREFLFTPRKTFYTVTDCLENKNFDVLNGKNGSMDTLSLFAQNNSQAQTFEIIPTNEESEYFYIIWNNEYAVTINENTNKLYIDKFAKANSQMWKFIAIN